MLKRIFRISTAVMMMVGVLTVQNVSAEEKAPAVVVSISSLDDVQSKIGAAASKIDPSYPMMVQMVLGQGAAFGLDGSKPAGVIVNMLEDGYGIAGFAPIKNQKMFDAQIQVMKDGEKLPQGVEFTSKDGYETILFNTEWDAAVPQFGAEKMLTVKVAPETLIPYLTQALAANPAMTEEKIADIQKSMKQVESVELSLDVTAEGNTTYDFTVTPKAESEVAGNFANSAKLSKTLLSNFYDESAPVAGQFLGTFDENNRRDLVKALTQNEEVPEELRSALLDAMDVQKIDAAFSFYADEKGVYGVLAMGISNGDKISAAIVKAIEKEDGEIKGKANVAKVGKSITIHQFGDENVDFAVGVHAKYLFLAVAANGESAVKMLKNAFKERKLEAGTVKQNGNFHFDASILKPYFPQCDFDFTGKAIYGAKYTAEKMNGSFVVEGALLETIGKIQKALQPAEDDDVFGDDDDDDDDDISAATGDDDDDAGDDDSAE